MTLKPDLDHASVGRDYSAVPLERFAAMLRKAFSFSPATGSSRN